MGHRVLIGGTGYDLPAAPVLVGGTVYNLIKGRTLIGGTGYDITFQTPDNTFDGLMATMNIVAQGNRNTSSTGTVFTRVSVWPGDVFYIFQAFNGYLTIEKVTVDYDGYGEVATLTKQTLKQTGNNTYKPRLISVATEEDPLLYAYVSEDGETSKAVYGASIFIVQFARYYQESMIDSILSGITLTRKAGRNSSSQETVSATYTSSDRLIAVTASALGYSSPVGTVIFGTHSSNPSMLRFSGSDAYISTDGESNKSTYGASIVAVTE